MSNPSTTFKRWCKVFENCKTYNNTIHIGLEAVFAKIYLSTISSWVYITLDNGEPVIRKISRIGITLRKIENAIVTTEDGVSFYDASKEIDTGDSQTRFFA